VKAWKSQVIEGRITRQDLRALIEKTIAVSPRTTLRLFVTVEVGRGVSKVVELVDGVRFELLTQDAVDAESEQG
jgi:hypothetical protein